MKLGPIHVASLLLLGMLSPVCRAQGVIPMSSNRGGVVGPAEHVRDTPCARADQEQPTLW